MDPSKNKRSYDPSPQKNAHPQISHIYFCIQYMKLKDPTKTDL